MPSGLINYDYASIADGVNHMRQINNNIRDQVSNLRKQVDELRGGFTGAASDSYDTCANRIAQELTKSNTQLDNLSSGVDRGANNMQTTDGAASRRFNQG